MTNKAGLPLEPGSTIGILGGGQLGRMLALAASRLGFNVHVFCPEENSPAFKVAEKSYAFDYDDSQALARFAQATDVITYEFENVPAHTAAYLSAKTPLYPNAGALKVAQDRLAEREFLISTGISIAPFHAISCLEDIERALPDISTPSVLKACRLGYDGKGQSIIKSAKDASDAWTKIGCVPAILEAFIPFEREVSVIIARSQSGQMVAYDPGENKHLNHILDETIVPANITVETHQKALEIARDIAQALDYVGILGVEMFVCNSPGLEALYVNEIAPRVHNSGHWTQDACHTDQFEQHIRAICGWPLGGGARHSDAVMKNLIGEDYFQWPHFAALNDHSVHLYGKVIVRPGRKMGHVNRTIPRKSMPKT
jgi:5-(carboxyamino)imidazole ribonucleotide synthase